ncbi:lysine-specific demethylase 3-like [Styela clava]|uniref:lysine-specific demethylase 3A-like n=1 Tax=Styela clava TaxID=7725 RepID=UPI0019393DE4|nr:lysine-specific demethylase 3A-like [Styela clava]
MMNSMPDLKSPKAAKVKIKTPNIYPKLTALPLRPPPNGYTLPLSLTKTELLGFAYHNNPRAQYIDDLASRLRKQMEQRNLENFTRLNEETGKLEVDVPLNADTPGITCLSSSKSPEKDFHTAIKNRIFECMRHHANSMKNNSQQQTQSVISEKAVLPETEKEHTASNTPQTIPDSSNLTSELGARTVVVRSEAAEENNVTKTSKEVSAVDGVNEGMSSSCAFLKSILCIDNGKKFQSDPNAPANNAMYQRPEDAAELPFSILTIRDQREYLKLTGDTFVQDAPCHEISKMYGVEMSGPIFGEDSWCKCRECRSAKQNENMAVFCRFYGFRKLRFKDKLLCTSGFLLPEECTEKDLQLWLPQKPCFWEDTKDCTDILSPNDPLDDTMSQFLLTHIAKRFCSIVIHEKKARSWVGKDEQIYWKRPVISVREMCDVCETTLFNMHWVCRKCGFGICLDCYERRMEKTESEQDVYDSDKSNHFRWLRCTKGKTHYHSEMLPTQIIPSTCLIDLGNMMHDICSARNIVSSCPCEKKTYSSMEILMKIHKMQQKQSVSSNPETNSSAEEQPTEETSKKRKSSASNWLSSINAHEQKCKERKLNHSHSRSISNNKGICLKDMIAKRIQNQDQLRNTSSHQKDEDYAQRNWLCEGRLLQLLDSQHPNNTDIFKLHWKYGMPVLVSGVGKYLNMDLWHPSQLSREYGEENSKNSMVNCMSGSIITNMKIRDFWDGFENISQRLLDENGKTMILKLKDWPPTEAFHDVMPEMFEDLQQALPLRDYTFVGGKCNVASRLPHFYVKPDLGPKMYNAYGWVTETDWRQGTTNLHLDISDAVNIMVYVGIPADEPFQARETLLQIVREGEVDDLQFTRAIMDKPGALWHIFHQRDVDKIRQFITKVCDERGETVAPDHDPIHDQQIYLDKQLRHRLKEEYNVEGYAILQCQGDGVFIPAGAPHQVFNLHSCIKIAEDFVSPEHIDKCFLLTNEFRYLSSNHSNHEDKLQIKNMIYHAVKDIVSSSLHTHCR